MADNVTANPGVGGATFATDEIAGAHHQRVKITLGIDGVSEGDVASSNPIPADTKKIAGQDIAAGAGATTAGTQRVVLPTDQPAIPVTDGGGSLTVDGSISVSSLPALPAGNNNIGDVDVASLPAITGSVTANAGTGFPSVSTAGSPAPASGIQALGTDGTNARALKTDAAGELQIDVLTLPAVSGTITANVGTTGGLALDATLTGGSAKAIPRGIAKGGTAAADVTVSSVDADHNALDVYVRGGSSGGGTEYAEDTASTAAEQLTMAGVVRKDAVGSLVDADGDRTELQVNASGSLRVDGSGVTQPVSGTVTANQGGTWNLTNVSGTVSLPTGASTLAEQQTQTTSLQLIDDVVHATNAALGKVAAVGGQLDDTGTAAATENNVAAARITAQRAFHVNLRADGGTEIGTSGAPVRTDPTGTTTQPVSGTVTANLGSAIPAGTNNIGDVDVLTMPAITGTVTANAGSGTFATQDSASLVDNAAFADGTSRLLPAGYAFDEVAGTALTENDVAAARVDSKRAQVLVIEDETTRGRRVTVTAANALKVDGSAVTQPVSGTVTANLAAGTNNIGDVDVLTLPALVAGNANIGDVDIASAPTGTSSITVQGTAATDAAVVGNPVYGGGRASAAVPTDVSADGDVVPSWHLRSGAQAVQVTAAGALITGDAGNGLDVDVTRVGGNVTVVQGTAASLKAQAQGEDAHDAAITGNPALMGAKASAAAPSDVSADNDAVRVWALRNGSLVANLAAGGALITGDATNGLDIDVTRLPALVAGNANIGDVDIASAPTGSSSITMQGTAATDAAVVGSPVYTGGRASAAAPTDVSADGDVVPAWRLRSGAAAVQVTAAGALIGGDATNGLDVDVTRLPALVAGTANIGDVDIASAPTGASAIQIQGPAADGAAVVGGPVRIGGKDGSGNTQDILTDISGNLSTKELRAGTSTRSQVADSATDAQILASNTSRLGAAVYNDSSAILYLGVGTTTVTTSNYTCKLFPNGYFEVPAGFTGELRGLWATDPNDGGAKVTELT